MAPASLARRLPSLVAGVITLLGCGAAVLAQDAPRGFAPLEVAPLTAAWPFTDPKFRGADAAPAGNGRAEATVKALADEISYSARFLPRTPPPSIAAGADDRPPPDTTLWPQAIPADAFARPPSRGDAAAWNLATRVEGARHAENQRALTALAHTAPGADGIATISPSADPAARNAARTFAGVLEARLRQRNQRQSCAADAWCLVLDAVEQKAAADGATASIEEAVAAYFFDAAAAGEYLAATREQRAQRAAERRELGFAPTNAVAPASSAATLSWEARLLLAGAILQLRGMGGEAPMWPLAFDTPTMSALRAAAAQLAGFDLSGIAITNYGPVAGSAGAFALAAAVTFVDAVARRASYSLVLRFSFADDVIAVATADAAPITPETPAAHIAFVSIASLLRVNRGSGIAAPFLRSLGGVAEREDTGAPLGAPQEYYIFAVVLDRIAPDARAGLRTSDSPSGIAGYPGMPIELDFDGWRVLVQRATFSLGAGVPFYFKAVYQAPRGDPVLLRGQPTALTTAVAAAPPHEPAEKRRAPAAAFPNRVLR